MFPNRPETADRRPQTADKKRRKSNFFGSRFFVFAVCSLQSAVLSAVLFFTGCGPKYTYPANTAPKSIEDICSKENHLEVFARIAGQTAGALIYIDDLVDDKGQIPKEVHEKMGQIMQAVTRVALSTDRVLDFCEVVIRDRAHMNELVVTRSVDDTKRANSDAIGVEESINRTLFSQGKYQLSPEGEKNFVLKEVKLENFLAEQIAQRIRFSFSKDAKEEAAGAFMLVDGLFDVSSEARRFRFALLSLKTMESRETMINALKTVRDVLGGYHFTNFSEIEILDYLNRQKLVIDQKTLADYQAKKITEQEILDRYLTESQSIQEAFKLFGFNLADSSSSADAEPRSIAAATP